MGKPTVLQQKGLFGALFVALKVGFYEQRVVSLSRLRLARDVRRKGSWRLLMRAFRILQHLPQRGLQPLADLLEGVQLYVLLAPFDGAVVSPVHPYGVSVCLLAESCGLASVTECFAYAMKKGACHDGTLVIRLFKLYSLIGGLLISSILDGTEKGAWLQEASGSGRWPQPS